MMGRGAMGLPCHSRLSGIRNQSRRVQIQIQQVCGSRFILAMHGIAC
jgi:hypothetical protein